MQPYEPEPKECHAPYSISPPLVASLYAEVVKLIVSTCGCSHAVERARAEEGVLSSARRLIETHLDVAYASCWLLPGPTGTHQFGPGCDQRLFQDGV